MLTIIQIDLRVGEAVRDAVDQWIRYGSISSQFEDNCEAELNYALLHRVLCVFWGLGVLLPSDPEKQEKVRQLIGCVGPPCEEPFGHLREARKNPAGTLH